MDGESYLTEISVLNRKLQSKAEALVILTAELNKCRSERDHFKLLAEQSQARYASKMPTSNSKHILTDQRCYSCGGKIVDTKETQKALLVEIDDLKQKLCEAQEDIRVLRRQNKHKSGADAPVGSNDSLLQQESLIKQLEDANSRCKQLQNDLASVLDEKEELVTERDAYRCKVHRLNHQLAAAVHAESRIDVDALVMENKYLQERLDQVKSEKGLLQHSLGKYKAMLDKNRNKGEVKLGTSASCAGMVVTHKQVQDLLDNGKLSNTEATLTDLRSLASALLEALQDKTLALAHQKKANKLLGERISDLETKITKDLSQPLFPSRLLMEGYAGSNVDKDVCKIMTDQDEVHKSCDDTSSFKLKLDANDENNFSRDDGLPPELQALVLKAMEDIKKEALCHSID